MFSNESIRRRCVLVKEVPEEVKEECLYSIRGVEKSHCDFLPTIGSGKVRWIILMTNTEEAEKLIRNGHVTLDSGGQKLDLPVGGCPECIIPPEWKKNKPIKPNDAGPGQTYDSMNPKIHHVVISPGHPSSIMYAENQYGVMPPDFMMGAQAQDQPDFPPYPFQSFSNAFYPIKHLPVLGNKVPSTEERISRPEPDLPSSSTIYEKQPSDRRNKTVVRPRSSTPFPDRADQRTFASEEDYFTVSIKRISRPEPELPSSSTIYEKQPSDRRNKTVVRPRSSTPFPDRADKRTSASEEDYLDEKRISRPEPELPSSSTIYEKQPSDRRNKTVVRPRSSTPFPDRADQRTFASEEDYLDENAKTCFRRKYITDGEDLTVEKYDASDPEMLEINKVLVRNLHPGTTEDTLMNYLEPAAGVDSIEVVRGSKSDTVIVMFDEKPDEYEESKTREKSALFLERMKRKKKKDARNKTSENMDLTSPDVKVAEVFKRATLPVMLAEYVLNPGDVQFFVMKGDVTKLQVDVIVNAASGGLNHCSGLALAISRAGGESIQRESYDYIKSNGTVPEGEAVPAKPGNLPCQMLIHAVGPRWQGGMNEEEVKLRHAIMKCLELTDKNAYPSIAIPALSAGNMGYPVDQSVRTIVSSIQFFFKSREGKSLKIKKIYVCDVDSRIVTAFIGCLKGKCGKGVKEFNGDKDSDIGDRKFRELNVEVRQGDITLEKTDAIVCCISESLDFSVGAVSKAILRAAGDGIVKECHKEAQSLSLDGFVVTSGGRMDCRNIIHVIAQRSADEWERMIAKVLAHADKTGCRSISFPALGTGVVDIDPAEIARCMLIAFRKFHHMNLQTVRVIVFQSQMFPVFKSTLQPLSQVPLQQTMDDFTRKLRVDIGLDDEGEGNTSIAWHRFKDPFYENMINRGHGYDSSHSNLKGSIGDLKRLQNEYERKDIDVSKCMLSDNQINEIKRLAKDTKVILKDGNIELLGLAANINEAAIGIHEYLHKVKDNERALAIKEKVEWWYEVCPDKWSTFRDDINLQIENAHQARMDSCIVKVKKGTEYVIDFKKMEEHVKNDYRKTFKIKRVDKGSHVGLPTTWKPMDTEQTMEEITLNNWDNEYQEVLSRFKATIKNTVSVSEILRVQNPYLYQQYAAKRKEIEVKNGKDPQKWLWHGTYPDTVHKIINNGFDRGHCGRNGTRFGAGVYFAVNASYSAKYCRPDSNGLKHIFCVQVATGNYCVGNSNMNVRPPKAGAGSHVTYDSASDNLSNPEMYVIFHDSQAYPAYHIIFK